MKLKINQEYVTYLGKKYSGIIEVALEDMIFWKRRIQDGSCEIVEKATDNKQKTKLQR